MNIDQCGKRFELTSFRVIDGDASLSKRAMSGKEGVDVGWFVEIELTVNNARLLTVLVFEDESFDDFLMAIHITGNLFMFLRNKPELNRLRHQKI